MVDAAGNGWGDERVIVAKPRERINRAAQFEKAAKTAVKTRQYVLRLYVAGINPRSSAAIRSVTAICEEHLKGRYDLEIVDIYQQPTLAKGEQIIAAPTLVKKLPLPLRRLIGDMANKERILVGLDLRPRSRGPNMPAKGKVSKRGNGLLRENEELRAQLAEAQETLRAIREGEVDAVIVSGTKGEQVFSLVGTDSIYRLIVETMKEAAFTVTFEGKILFCNAQFGRFVQRPLEQVIGHPLQEFVAQNNHAAAASLLIAAQRQPVKQRLVLQAADGTAVPAHVSANILNQADDVSICVVATDLTDLENSTDLIQQLRPPAGDVAAERGEVPLGSG